MDVYYDSYGNVIGVQQEIDDDAIKVIKERMAKMPITVEDKSLRINDFAEEVHSNAVAHGWWETEREIPEIIALCHSELSEALEAYRNGEEMFWMNGDKPDGIGVELCDCIIRILDYLAHKEFDIEFALLTKHGYNITRPYKHGGKKI